MSIFFHITAAAVFLVSIAYGILSKKSSGSSIRTIWSGIVLSIYLIICSFLYSSQMGDYLPVHLYEIDLEIKSSLEFPEIFISVLCILAIPIIVLMIISMIKRSEKFDNIVFNIFSILVLLIIISMVVLLIAFNPRYISLIAFLPLYLPIVLSLLASAFQMPTQKSRLIKSYIIYGFSIVVSLVFIIGQFVSVFSFPEKIPFFIIMTMILLAIPGVNIISLILEQKKSSNSPTVK